MTVSSELQPTAHNTTSALFAACGVRRAALGTCPPCAGFIRASALFGCATKQTEQNNEHRAQLLKSLYTKITLPRTAEP
ncbi:jg19540 [Pararge aegeria aegeria]|uniref:Jg19540 protein n=1 Tax=Pararge aegeria aegeria TaxID=348720 RepID=A0A8S4R5R1_9NEOP|nr:jg19540 [Pararge aegeria aegeria]